MCAPPWALSARSEKKRDVDVVGERDCPTAREAMQSVPEKKAVGEEDDGL